MSPMQRCFSDLVCQPLVTSDVIDAYLCLAMLHACTLKYQHMICSASDCGYPRRQKGDGQLEKIAGSPRNVWLNKLKVQEDANALVLSTLWRSEITMGHGPAQRFTRTTRRR